MVTVDAETSARDALGLFVRSGFSRIPVVGEDVDDVRGVLYFKDVVQRLETRGGDAAGLTAEQMMRPAEYTVEMKPADDLLRQMQSEHFHLALVVDEYGGISGLVTLEDLLEEVVGELTDEHDRNVVEPEEVSPGVWRVPARFPVDELGELLGLEVEDEDVDSVGGLLGKAIGKVPLPGSRGDLLGIHMVAEEGRGRRRQVGTILCSRATGEGGVAPATEDEDEDEDETR
jgi:CBS domain containing-hemolysin-like protein